MHDGIYYYRAVGAVVGCYLYKQRIPSEPDTDSDKDKDREI